ADHWLSKKSLSLKYGWYGILIIFIFFLGIKTKSQVDVWQDSESLWTQALQYYPNEDLILANRGNHRGKTGNIKGAMSDFEVAIADGCDRADVYEGLGNSYGTMSEQQPENKNEYIGKAISMFNKALELDPENGQVRYNLGVAQLQTNPAASEIAFKEALKRMPYKEANILPVLGLSQLNSGNYLEAIKTLTKVIESGKATDAVFYHRGLANLGVGNRESAKNDFDQALAINPGNADVKARLAAM
ncbi:MAG: tetratricopeptide repeat protein, partial [Saprospiraceae bacterium]